MFPLPQQNPIPRNSKHKLAMAKPKKSEILKLSFIATLLIISPLIPTSLRPTYLYFLFNLLIIALGAEAGLLSFFSKPSEDKKPITIPPKPTAANTVRSSAPNEVPPNSSIGNIDSECGEKRPKVVEKCSSEKIVGVANKVSQKVKKCASTPSIFFIGGGGAGDEAEEVVDEDESSDEEKEEEVKGKELFTKAETFIGNFYKQLKMQREESWKRIHGFYQKAF